MLALTHTTNTSQGKGYSPETKVCSEVVVHFLQETLELRLPGKLFHSEFSLTSGGQNTDPNR